MATAKVIPTLSVVPQKPAPKRPKTSPKRPKPSTSRPKTPVSVARGEDSRATARGKDAVAVAGGTNAHARLLNGDSAEAVAAAGFGCIAETFDSLAYLAAAGASATAISHCRECPAVAVGYEPLAIAPDEGTAISIGSSPAAMAGKGGTLVFIDTSSPGGPHTFTVKVGSMDADYYVRPGIPYYWMAGWDRVEVDTDWLLKLEREEI